MSGPIVRSAPSKKFSSNWDAVFAGKGGGAGKTKGSALPAAKKPAKKHKKKGS